MPAVQLEGLARQQVHGNRVAGKRVDCQNIKILRTLSFKQQPGVSKSNLNRCVAIPEKTELAVGQPDHERIDLIEPVIVACPPVTRQHSRSETNDPYTNRG